MKYRDIHLRLISNLLSELNDTANMKSKSYSEGYFYAAKKHLLSLFGTFECYDLQTFTKSKDNGWDTGGNYETEHKHLLRRYELNGNTFHLPMKIYAFLGYNDFWKESPLFPEYKEIVMTKIKGIKEGIEIDSMDFRNKYAYLFELICAFCKNELNSTNLSEERKLQVNNLYLLAKWVCDCLEKDTEKRLTSGDRFDFYWYDYEHEKELVKIDSDVYWHFDVVYKYIGQATPTMDKLRNKLLSILNEEKHTQMGTGTFELCEKQRHTSFHALKNNGFQCDFHFNCEVTGKRLPYTHSPFEQEINADIYKEELENLQFYYDCASKFIKKAKDEIKGFWSESEELNTEMKLLAYDYKKLLIKKGIIQD